jgi:hypothetical protein
MRESILSRKEGNASKMLALGSSSPTLVGGGPQDAEEMRARNPYK